MRRSRSSRRLAAVSLVAVVALGTSVAARGAFSAGASAGPLQVSTATLAAPAAPAVQVWSCRPSSGATVSIWWDGGGQDPANVQVVRASSPGGPFVPILDQTPIAGHYFDTTRTASSTVYYAARTVAGSWQSPLSAVTSIRLPDQRCRP